MGDEECAWTLEEREHCIPSRMGRESCMSMPPHLFTKRESQSQTQRPEMAERAVLSVDCRSSIVPPPFAARSTHQHSNQHALLPRYAHALARPRPAVGPVPYRLLYYTQLPLRTRLAPRWVTVYSSTSRVDERHRSRKEHWLYL